MHTLKAYAKTVTNRLTSVMGLKMYAFSFFIKFP